MKELSQIQQINQTIMFGQFTNTELESILSAVKFARSNLTRHVANSIKIGSQVKFTSQRRGQTITGTVESIKIKNAIVATPLGRYRVPMNMLEAV